MLLIMVGHGISMFGNHVSSGINLHHYPTPVFLPEGKQAGRVGVHAIVG
jgi:hypothetical protein